MSTVQVWKAGDVLVILAHLLSPEHEAVTAGTAHLRISRFGHTPELLLSRYDFTTGEFNEPLTVPVAGEVAEMTARARGIWRVNVPAVHFASGEVYAADVEHSGAIPCVGVFNHAGAVAAGAVAITPATSDDLCNVGTIVYDEAGQPLAGVAIRFRLVTAPNSTGAFAGEWFDSNASGAEGVVQIPGLWREATYEFQAGAGTIVTAPIPDAATFELPKMIHR